jgi:hypothetical protein
MRADVKDINALAFAHTKTREYIILGDLQMPRSAFDWNTRRIGPNSLRDTPYHRGSWLNLLLPYCPESLELLVDACPFCGPLGWRHTRGVSNCERCGERVSASLEPGLKKEFAAEYRAAAQLMSRDPANGASAIQHMPSALQRFSRTVLVELMTRVGMACSPARTTKGIKEFTRRPPSLIAEAMCAGMRILHGWPRSVQAHLDQCTNLMAGDISAYAALCCALRQIGRATPEGHEIVSTTFPKIDGRTSDTFACNDRYYTASQANTLLCTASSELKRLRDAQALRYEQLSSKRRLHARYHAEDVDTLLVLLRNSKAAGSAGAYLDLPTYAVEQIADRGNLEIIAHPGIVALRGPQVAADSLTDLASNLRAKAKRSAAPENYVMLKSALPQCPGEKPWGLTVEALLTGSIPFHMKDEKLSLRSVLVNPVGFPFVGTATPDYFKIRLGIAYISLSDACEILATRHVEGLAAINSAGLEIVRGGRANGVARQDLRDLGGKIAFVGEAAAFTGRNGRTLHHEFTRIGVPRIHGAWSRPALAALGMVRPMNC